MTYPLVRFVEAPDPAAAVRFDCNRAGEDGVAARRVMAEGFTLGSPTLEGDPDAVGVTYGFRQPSFTQRVKGSKQEALAALSSLSRELLRRTNWVMVQLTATTAPVWLKIYRSGFAPLSLAQVYVKTATGDPVLMPDTWEIEVPLVADPFGYGARETLATVEMGSSLSHARPMRYVLPALKGDAPTGLRLSVEQQGQAADAVRVVVVASDDPVTDPVYDIGTGDGFTAGSGTDAGVSDTDYLGGFYRTVTIGTGANFLLRLSGTIAAPPPRGRYKVLVRCEADPIDGATANRYMFAFGVITADTFYLPTVTLDTPGAGSVFRGWVDLGEVSFPRGIELPDDVTPGMSSLPWVLKIGTPGLVAGVVRLDAFKLVPIDGPSIRNVTALHTVPQNTTRVMLGTDETGHWDADRETYWRTDVGDIVDVQMAPQALRGGFPIADPAATENVLLIFPDGAVSQSGGVWDATVSYHPRFLHLGDGT